jgi:hypothetical protein
MNFPDVSVVLLVDVILTYVVFCQFLISSTVQQPAAP